jgi:hypothetical protein
VGVGFCANNGSEMTDAKLKINAAASKVFEIGLFIFPPEAGKRTSAVQFISHAAEVCERTVNV